MEALYKDNQNNKNKNNVPKLDIIDNKEKEDIKD